RLSPQRHGRKALLWPVIPAYPRSARKRHDRPVTPEVAGSSPVAPVKDLRVGLFSCPCRRKRTPVFCDPVLILPGCSRRKPCVAAKARSASAVAERSSPATRGPARLRSEPQQAAAGGEAAAECWPTRNGIRSL